MQNQQPDDFVAVQPHGVVHRRVPFLGTRAQRQSWRPPLPCPALEAPPGALGRWQGAAARWGAGSYPVPGVEVRLAGDELLAALVAPCAHRHMQGRAQQLGTRATWSGHGTGSKNSSQKISTGSKGQLFISSLKSCRVPEVHTLSLALMFTPLSSKNFRTSRLPPRHAQCRAVEWSFNRKKKLKVF